jgi:hypothetical protein
VSGRRGRTVGVLALVALVSLSGRAVAATPPSPPSTTPASTASRLALLAQDPWTAVGGQFHAQVQIGVSGPGLQLSVVAHNSLATRSAFDKAVNGTDLGSVLSQVVVPVDGLATNPDGSRQLTIGLTSPNGPLDPTRLDVPRAGVYPLEVQLRDNQAQTLARFVSYLVVVGVGVDGQPAPLTNRLGVAWVWPLGTRPALDSSGSVDPAVTQTLQPDGTIGRQIAAIVRQPNVAVTLAPSPDTLDAWTTEARTEPGVAAGANALRAAQSAVHEVIAGPYVPIDLPSLLHAGLGTAADAQYVQGATSLDRFFGSHIDDQTALALPADTSSLGTLRAHGVDQVVVDEDAVGAAVGRLTTVTPFSVEPPPSLAPTGPVAAVADDARLASLLTGGDPPALRAQRFLAGLALTALEQPGVTRAVVVVNPTGFDPPSALLDAVLAGLVNHPWLSPMTLGDVFSSVPPTSAGDVRTLAPDTPPPPPVSASAFNATEARLVAFGSLIGPGDPRIARGERLLLSSLSSAWTGLDAFQASGQLHTVDSTISDFLDRIRIPAPGTITLTARSGAVPITFRNDTGQAVRVVVALSSRRLDFPSGSVQAVALPPRSTTVRFDVRSRTSGTFPLEMSIRSADGTLLIAQGRFKVRSTVVSSVALALAAGAVVFLAGWWIFDFRRRRARARSTP